MVFTSTLQRTSIQISQAMEGALSGGESSLGSNIPYPDSITKLPRSLTQLQVGGTFQSTQALPTCQGIVNLQHLSPILGFPILGLLHNRKSLNVKWILGSATSRNFPWIHNWTNSLCLQNQYLNKTTMVRKMSQSNLKLLKVDRCRDPDYVKQYAPDYYQPAVTVTSASQRRE